MRRVVLDANVLISGVMARNRPETTTRRIIRAWETRQFELVISEQLVEEVKRNLDRLHVGGRVPGEHRDEALDMLRTDSFITPITIEVSGVASHSQDDLILATALSARVDFLVTGDKQLLLLGAFAGIPIVTPRRFLDELESE